MEGPQLRTEQEIIGRFQELRSNMQGYWNKINELEAEMGEHDLVIKALEPMEGSRKCSRLIGGVLVERTVAEVLPAVKGHREQLETGQEDEEEDATSSSKNMKGVLVSHK